MRIETKNLQTRVDELAASDERTASTIQSLISWLGNVRRAIETNREENKRAVDRTADLLNGELETLSKELIAISDKLRGDEDLEADAETDKPRKSKKDNVIEYPAAESA